MEHLEKEFWEQDKYISENEYKKFWSQNNITADMEKLKKRNEEFVHRKLIEYDSYFHHMFDASNMKINLDDEQKRIILKDDDYCLINAGAGTGKSTTMAAKVKYLVDKLHVNPKEIIMLSFTKKSSEDLDEKVNHILNLGIPVSTFHSLGMQFIKLMKPEPIKVADENEKRKIIERYIATLFQNKKNLLEFLELFKVTKQNDALLIKANNNGLMRGFVENAPKFDTFEEYFKDYKKRKYEKEIKNGGIRKYIKKRLTSKTNLKTINGELCKSIGEVRIANFLTSYCIDYEYERVFEERVNENKIYTPDFTIEVSGQKVYIEYFGMSECLENNRLIKKRVEKYNRIRRKKEQYQKAHPEYDFINLDYQTIDGNYIDTLRKELLKRGMVLHRLSDDEIFDKIISNNPSAEFFKFTNLAIKFIEILKNMLVDDVDYIFEKRMKQISEEKFEEKYYSDHDDIEVKCRIKALKYMNSIYHFYQNELIKNQLIDYDDMINESYKYIIRDLKKSSNLRYQYVIVDEYQDITFQRFLFVKRLIEYFNAKLIAVGDDWQSIYSFTGSRLELFNQFSELYQKEIEEQFLSTTYRYGQELADISSNFLSVNDEQSKKKIKAIKSLKTPVEIINYSQNNEEEKVFEVVERLYRKNPEDMILILARTNKQLQDLQKSEFFDKGLNDVLICKKYPEANIEAITMHRSKGLTADQVIVFGLQESVFPSKGYKNSWLFKYFRLDTVWDVIPPIDGVYYHFIKETFPYAEERRLFYVALTRTKNKVFLIVPESSKLVSGFVIELKKML